MMIEFIEVIDPYSHRYETRKTSIMPERIQRVLEVQSMHNRAGCAIQLENDKLVYVSESYVEAVRRIEEHKE